MKNLSGSQLYVPHSLLGDSVLIQLKNGISFRMKIIAFTMEAELNENVELIYKGYDTEGLNVSVDVEEIEFISIQ